MYFQQEIWLVLVGLLVAVTVKSYSSSAAPMARVILFASTASLLVGWFGMAVKGIFPILAFFPSDVRGMLITAFAAFLAAKFVVRQPRRQTTKSQKNQKLRK